MKNNWDIDTALIHHSKRGATHSGAVVEPIIPAVAYAFPDTDTAAAVVSGEKEGVYYGRYGNPTLFSLEEKIASLEGGEAALGVSSGMAAISIALLAYLKQGDHVVVTKDVYGGTYKFLTNIAVRYGIEYNFVDCTNPEFIHNHIKENTRAIYIETPSNPHLTILDIKKISEISKLYGIPLIIDNTFMSPYLQNPLELGANIVVHSATKYLNGHGDSIAGFIVGNSDDITFMRNSLMGDLGQVLSAWDAFLILRGLKTLGVRMERHCKNALEIATFLENHPQVEKVYYPGLPSHPQHELAKEQMKGMGGIVSFELKDGKEAGKRFIDSLKLIIISFSLGDPETLVQHPASMTHFSIPMEEREKFGITDGLIRLSLGLENAKDLINDLEQALMVRPKVDIELKV
ncbi:trans-sulfuration enzyme family protein [Oceanobacillus sojae]|uniref:L-methionine gamma-lyase n=1 Tax=Oceanobacillus sojae TaxID=582851 RepID=A0A511ZNQ8_9BACI|nr:aminotransferase class I/II-fold pyridoxal phosphate-dependent enzyme [Oceanobacillus sojae]GEN89091.1 L-methionine gamma-lyase [Oceanobacillus sojae]